MILIPAYFSTLSKLPHNFILYNKKIYISCKGMYYLTYCGPDYTYWDKQIKSNILQRVIK